MTKRKLADVYVTPEGGVGGEFPTPIPFWAPGHSRRFVENYAQACESLGQKVRVVWYAVPYQPTVRAVPQAHEPLAGAANLRFLLEAWAKLYPAMSSYQRWQLVMNWATMDSSRREAIVKHLQAELAEHGELGV